MAPDCAADIAILLLAGGASARMGARDKLTEPVHGQPLVQLQAHRALEVSRDVTILLRPGNIAARQTLRGLPLRVMHPVEALEGMGGSLRAGSRTLADRPAFLLLLADLVELTPEDMRLVITARQNHPGAHIWRGMTSDGKPGHPILFDRVCYEDLSNLSGDQGARDILHHHPVHPVPLPGQRARRDLDTPSDWAEWQG